MRRLLRAFAFFIPLIVIAGALSLLAPSTDIKPRQQITIEHSLATYDESPRLPAQSEFNLIQQKTNLSSEQSRFHWLKVTTPSLQSFNRPIFVSKPNTIFKYSIYTEKDDSLQLVSKHSRFDFIEEPIYSSFNKVVRLENHKAFNEFYFLIEEISDQQVSLELWELEEYLTLDFRYNALFSALVFGILLMICINFFFYLTLKDNAYLYYIAYHGFGLLLIMMSSGYIFNFSPLSFLANSLQIAVFYLCLCSFFFASFVRKFLNTKHYTPRLDKAILFYQVIYAAAFFANIVIADTSALVSFVNLVIMSSVIFYSLVMYSHLKLKNRPAIFFALAFMMFFISISLRIVYIFGYLPPSFFVIHGTVVAMLFEAMLFSTGLADRVLQFQTQRDSAKLMHKKTSFVYDLEKDFASLLNQVTRQLRTKEHQDLEQFVTQQFFENISQKLHFKSSAVVYKTSDNFNLVTNNPNNISQYQGLIEEHIESLISLNDTTTIETFESTSGDFLVLPVSMREHEWSLVILEFMQDEPLTAEIELFLQHYATELVRCLANARGFGKIKHQADYDSLTSVFNRRAILERLETLFLASKYSKNNLSIAFIDIDDFKQVNDNFGHAGGDLCLTSLASVLQRNLPENCRIGRFGGDEFLVVMPGYDAKAAHSLIHKSKLSILPIISGDRLCNYTISIGIASITGEINDIHELLREADNALYSSKTGGKDSIQLA